MRMVTGASQAGALLVGFVWLVFCPAVLANPVLSEGDVVISERQGSRCAPIRSLEVAAKHVDLFEDRVSQLKKLISGAIAKVSFECDQLKRVRVAGLVSGVEVFSAEADIDDGWNLKFLPTPLERLTGQIGSIVKELPDVVKLRDSYAQFRKVPNIESTFQHFAFMHMAQDTVTRLLGNGGLVTIRQYAESVYAETQSVQETKAKTQPIAESISVFLPDRAQLVATELASALRQFEEEEWNAYLVTAFAEGDIYGSFFSDLRTKLANTSPNADLVHVIDQRVNEWVRDEVELYESLLESGFLSDVAEKRLLSTTLARYILPEDLAITSKTLKASASRIEVEAKQELAQLLSAAKEIVAQTGESYADLTTVVETGMSLASEFEAAGFGQEAKLVLASISDRTDSLIDAGLDVLKQELGSAQMTRENIARYREQADIFEELSAQFEGFSGYIAAIEEGITNGRERICVTQAADSVSDESYLSDRILMGEGAIEIRDLACRLFRNDHILATYKRGWLLSSPALEIDLSGEGVEKYELGWDDASEAYVGTKKLDVEASPLPEQAWIDRIDKLTILPPSGRPDAAGVTECDLLAADPQDSHRKADGVAFEQVDPDYDFERAIDACIAAIEFAPEEPRNHYQLARVLSFLGVEDEAGYYAELAMSRNYGPAFYLRAQSRMMDEGDDAFFDSIDLLKLSAEAGYQPAKALLEELIPPGVEFYREIPAPTDSEILSAVDTSVCSGIMNMSLCVRLTGVHRKDCFQMSATDFSCELTFNMRCDSAGDPLLSLFTNACPAYSDPQFRTFRKLDGGHWRSIN